MAKDRATNGPASNGKRTAASSDRPRDTAPPASPRVFGGFSEITSFLWSVADLLRGDYKQADYGKVILPLTVHLGVNLKERAEGVAEHAKEALHDATHPAHQPKPNKT